MAVNLLLLIPGTVISGWFAFSAYWAFSIRHALAVRIYRGQALGVGLIAVCFAIFSILVEIVSGIFRVVNSGIVLLFAYVPILFAIAIFTFYFVDSSILAARRSDPLNRDTFHWNVARKVGWALIVLWLALFISVYAFSLYSTVPILGYAWVPIPLVPGITGAVVLPVSFIRSKDITFKKHLKWFGAFVVIELILTLSSAVAGLFPLALVDPFAETAAFILLASLSYALYRSARSLAPLNRMQ